MTCFSRHDRKALYRTLARDARIRAQGCTEAGMRQALLNLAESFTLLASLEDTDWSAIRPDSLSHGTSRDGQGLRDRYAGQEGEIAISWAGPKAP